MSTTKEKAVSNLRANNWLDRLFMGVAAGVILTLAYRAILDHVKAAYPMNYILSGVFVGLMCYLIVAPLIRRK